jgi:hypothetical protein
MVKRYGLDTAQKYTGMLRVSEELTTYGDAATKEK